MKLIDSIAINAPAATVWSYLVHPENQPLWNPKVKRVAPASFSPPGPGFRYAITYQMHERARATEFLAEFVRFEPQAKLVIRHTGGLGPRNQIIEEIYDLSERDGGTFLVQTVDIRNSGINIFFRLLIWFIQRWGKPTGERYLETLRNIIEQRVPLQP
jgi:uncharacterized protein YndB with AHSA1/START domain